MKEGNNNLILKIKPYGLSSEIRDMDAESSDLIS
jgi:hypothetical protein